MDERGPRGVVVVDVGTTNTKLILFDADGRRAAEEKIPSAHSADFPLDRRGETPNQPP